MLCSILDGSNKLKLMSNQKRKNPVVHNKYNGESVRDSINQIQIIASAIKSYKN